METCQIEDCDYPAKSRGWCQAHYMRWYTTGQTGGPVVRRPKGRTCSVPGCDRKHVGLGYCSPHYMRYKTHGDPGPAEIEVRDPSRTCSIDGCETRVSGLGYCEKHYQRFRKHGSAEWEPPVRGSRWIGNAAGYGTVHIRLRNERGAASSHECVSCGAAARDWAYQHGAPDERVEDGKPYSLNLDYYAPMCRDCHRQFDADRTSRRGCVVPGCAATKHRARGYCDRHYQQAKKHGFPEGWLP